MSDNQKGQVPWEQPMDELSEHNIRQVVGVVHRGIVGLLHYFEGFEEWMPDNYEFWAKHPDLKESLADTSVEEIINNLRNQREKLKPALEALDYMVSDEMLPIYKMISQPGYGKMITGIANLALFLRLFGLRQPGQE